MADPSSAACGLSHRGRLWWAALWMGVTATLGGLCACGPAPDGRPPVDDGGTPSADDAGRPGGRKDPLQLALGIGWSCFDPYVDDAPIYLQRGGQGGQHLNTTVLVVGLPAPDGHAYRVWLTDAGGVTVLGTQLREALFEPATDVVPSQPPSALIERGGYLFVPAPDELIGQTMTINVRLEVADGRVVTQAATGPVAWMPDDYPALVETWCSD